MAATGRCSRTRTSARLRSSESATPLTSPITTPRYFTGVMPTRTPPPSAKLSVTSGPCSSMRCQMSHLATRGDDRNDPSEVEEPAAPHARPGQLFAGHGPFSRFRPGRFGAPR